MNIVAPIIVDLGETRKETITQFRSGSGQLVEDIQEVMRRVCSTIGVERPGRIFVPVIMICKQLHADHDEAVAEVWQHDPDCTGT